MLKLQHVLITPKVLQAKECTPTPSIIFTLGLAFESFKEFGDVSSRPIAQCGCEKHYMYVGNV
jgi:hypothetical protein